MSTTQSHRPYGLATELPDPPRPPLGHRFKYRGIVGENGNQFWHFYINELNPETWKKSTSACGDPNFLYIQAVPLRPVPEGVAEVPEGFEYYDAERFSAVFNPGDVLIRSGAGWQPALAVGKYSPAAVAMRIGSEIHHRHFDYGDANRAIEADFVKNAPLVISEVQAALDAKKAAEPEFRYFRDADGIRYKVPSDGRYGFKMVGEKWVGCGATMILMGRDLQYGTVETDADGNPLVPINPEHPARAREWTLSRMDNGMILPSGDGFGLEEKEVRVREVLPGERGLIEAMNLAIKRADAAEKRAKESHTHAEAEAKAHDECRHLLNEAVGHLRAVTNNQYLAAPHSEALSWLSRNFPEPAPEPFDMDKLWAMLPPWITNLACDYDGDWQGFAATPRLVASRVWEGSFAMTIPIDCAPPPAADWKLSLVQRPTPAQP